MLRTAFKEPQSWLNYRSGFGEIVDRFRWEGGCIVEHVSALHCFGLRLGCRFVWVVLIVGIVGSGREVSD